MVFPTAKNWEVALIIETTLLKNQQVAQSDIKSLPDEKPQHKENDEPIDDATP
ncbi:MAG: hypothetical protein IV298_06915 [Cylindrospermopsis raciborskii KL1]|jgi:hypothetical protein|uniref:hypothetical protein n=1 Tax=Cylindrospermopsis raciborskii TaxID=77022 RepID=UPI001A330A26|nr:hypothetical protein [Cylindrospermopsis raciborskii]MBG0743204.1 hypothetical protein [Cylindrospermopsis raciborskii KL1]